MWPQESCKLHAVSIVILLCGERVGASIIMNIAVECLRMPRPTSVGNLRFHQGRLGTAFVSARKPSVSDRGMGTWYTGCSIQLFGVWGGVGEGVVLALLCVCVHSQSASGDASPTHCGDLRFRRAA